MKKRIFALLLVLIMAISLAAPAAAYEDHYYVYTAISAIDNARFVEQGEETLPAVSENAQFDLRVDIVDDLEDDTIAEYAALFYEQYEYGWGDDKDGALLMIYLEDNGDSVNFADYIVYGGGSGVQLLNSADGDVLYQTLDLTLTGSNVAYDEAGQICADAIDIYMGLMLSMLNANPEGSAMLDAALAGDSAEVPVEAPAAEESAPATQTYIQDGAALLTGTQVTLLESRAKSLADQYDCGVYVATVETMSGTDVREFAKDYYEANGLGVGGGSNGILFLVCMDSREYVTVTYGTDPAQPEQYGVGIMAYTDTGIAAMEDAVVPLLSDGDYQDAFSTYLDHCAEYLAYYEENGVGMEADTLSLGLRLAIIVLVPLLIALIVCLIFRSQMKTAKIAKEAGNYIPEGSFVVTARQDRYTHTTKSRTKIEKSSGSTVDRDGFGGSSGGKF